MKALVYENKISIVDIPKPTPGPGESLIRITKSGICNTDIEITKGYMQYTGVMGHEFVGVVEQSESNVLLHKRVVGEINLGCGHCELCNKSLERHCFNRSVIGIFNYQGAFAEYLVLPDKNLKVVPDQVADFQAVFVEPLAAALEILEQVHIDPNQRIAIVGDGKLALLIYQVIRLTGADCTVFGKHSKKLDIAKNLGAKTFISDATMTTNKFDIVIEASGNNSGFSFAQQLVMPRGVLILKSTFAGESNIDLSKLVIDEVTLVGSRCGKFTPALKLLEQGLINTSILIEKEFPFSDASAAFLLATQCSLKVLLDYN